MKVDVAIQSYKKPELLIYTLLSLKKHSGKHIDIIYINDDGSSDEQFAVYESRQFQDAMSPIKIKTRRNKNRMGWWYAPVKGLNPKWGNITEKTLKNIKFNIKSKAIKAERSDVRYQWAIDNTDKEFLFILHDDIIFYADVIELYINSLKSMENPGAVGDLGQCWRCGHAIKGCNPKKILSGTIPDPSWPDYKNDTKNRWPCRLNEWCLMIAINAAKTIEERDNVLFGNYDNKGDIGAYWFSLLVKYNFNFSDPAIIASNRQDFYIHADGGSGHSAWVDQGNGIVRYESSIIKSKLWQDFSFKLA